MQIISYMPMYSKITKCFDYGHIFSHKVGYEKFQETLADGQKVAFVYDPALMNKGSHGILLTNKNLYFYKNNEIREFDLSAYECMQVREGKIYILHGGEEIDTGLSVNLDQILYNFFSEAIDKVVLMCRAIKNSESELNDEDVYDNIIVRSKQVEYVRHNKKTVAIAVGIVVFILAIVLVNVIPEKNTDILKPEEEEAYEEVENVETENIVESSNMDESVSADSEISANSSYSDWIVPTDTSEYWNLTYGDDIISLLNNEIMCWYLNLNSACTLSDIISGLEEGSDVIATSYTIVDMDSDARPEIVVNLSGNLDDYYLIIHYNESEQSDDYQMYVMTCGIRSMQMLQVNGVFMGSNGASSTGYYLYDFEPQIGCTQIELAYVEDENYSVQSTPVTKAEFDDYVNLLYADLVEWRDYSLATLAEEVGASWVPEEDVYESSEYILEGSDQYYLDWYELEGLTAEECKIARNEIYARHGRMFNDAELQEYFNSCSWYTGYISAEDFDEDILSDIEKSNRDLIIEYESEMGYR